MIVSSSPTAMQKKPVIVHYVHSWSGHMGEAKRERRFYDMHSECSVRTWCGQNLEGFPVSVIKVPSRPCVRCVSAANFQDFAVELAPPVVVHPDSPPANDAILKSTRYWGNGRSESITYYQHENANGEWQIDRLDR